MNVNDGPIWWCIVRFHDAGKKIMIAPTSMIRNLDGSPFKPVCAQDLPNHLVEVKWQEDYGKDDVSFDGYIEASVVAIASSIETLKAKAIDMHLKLQGNCVLREPAPTQPVKRVNSGSLVTDTKLRARPSRKGDSEGTKMKTADAALLTDKATGMTKEGKGKKAKKKSLSPKRSSSQKTPDLQGPPAHIMITQHGGKESEYEASQNTSEYGSKKRKKGGSDSDSSHETKVDHSKKRTKVNKVASQKQSFHRLSQIQVDAMTSNPLLFENAGDCDEIPDCFESHQDLGGLRETSPTFSIKRTSSTFSDHQTPPISPINKTPPVSPINKAPPMIRQSPISTINETLPISPSKHRKVSSSDSSCDSGSSSSSTSSGSSSSSDSDESPSPAKKDKKQPSSAAKGAGSSTDSDDSTSAILEENKSLRIENGQLQRDKKALQVQVEELQREYNLLNCMKASYKSKNEALEKENEKLRLSVLKHQERPSKQQLENDDNKTKPKKDSKPKINSEIIDSVSERVLKHFTKEETLKENEKKQIDLGNNILISKEKFEKNFQNNRLHTKQCARNLTAMVWSEAERSQRCLEGGRNNKANAPVKDKATPAKVDTIIGCIKAHLLSIGDKEGPSMTCNLDACRKVIGSKLASDGQQYQKKRQLFAEKDEEKDKKDEEEQVKVQDKKKKDKKEKKKDKKEKKKKDRKQRE